MGTYAELKQQIVFAVGRDDLEDDFADQVDIHVKRAVEHYGARRFWFNRLSGTVTTAADTATVALPASCRFVERVTGTMGVLEPRDFGDMPYIAASSYPGFYAYDNGSLTLYPTPDAAYALNFIGVKQIDAPTTDAATNVWTTEAATMIVYRAAVTLALEVARDQDKANELAPLLAVEEARMQSETTRREGTRRRAQLVDNAGTPMMSRYPL
jgi:hypothetical protein